MIRGQPSTTRNDTIWPDTTLFRSCLGADEDMEAAPFRAAIEDRPDQRRHSLGIDAEGLGAAAHAHARALDFELRVHANGQAGPEAEAIGDRSEEHTSELQSLMRISYAVFCLKKKITT